MQSEQDLIQQTAAYVQEVLSGNSAGHDWWPVYRVWQTARGSG